MLSENEKIELVDLQNRSRNIIIGTCNTIGCADCGLKWEDDNGKKTCSSIELEGKIMDLQAKDWGLK